MAENPNENIDIPEKLKSQIEIILDFLKDPKSKPTQEAILILLKNVIPHPLYKVVGDVLIGGVCIFAIIYCADKGYIEKANVQSLLALVVGAIIGARFKS
jgi:hypothetical protein